jgi:hypothetical protein
MSTNTLIDQAVDAFIAAVSTTPGVTGVYEDRQQAYEHADAPAIEISLRDATGDVLGDDHPARSVLKTTLLIELAIYTRSAIREDGTEATARSLASPIWLEAHKRLMADPSLGNLALRIRWQRSTWRKEASDGTAGWASHTYEVFLAMREHNLLAPL